MSILGVQGTTSAGYSNPYSKHDNSIAASAYSNPSTGPDRVSFSEEALKLAQSLPITTADAKGGEGVAKDELSSSEVRSTPATSSSLTELAKTSLFSMLLESLFLAELEESAAGNGTAANDGTEYAGEEGAQRQPRTAKGSNPLEDGEKVAELKKILTDFTKGKIELSDLPQVMAGASAAGAGKAANATTQREGGSAAHAGSEE